MKWPPAAIGLTISALSVASGAVSRIGAALFEWVKKTYVRASFYEVVKTACGEVAVLLFVFPMIDMLGKDVNPPKRNWPFVVWCILIGFVFIGIAGKFGEMHENAEAQKEEERNSL